MAKREEWKPVLGFEGLYEVSDEGRVRGVARRTISPRGTRAVPARMMTIVLDKDGYPVVCLSKNGERRPYKVHRLVCEAFNGLQPSPIHQVCHNNAVRHDNRRSNLRWGTARDNFDDRDRHGNTCRGSRNGFAKFTDRDIRSIRRRASVEKRVNIAADYGVHAKTIGRIAMGHRYKDVV